MTTLKAGRGRGALGICEWLFFALLVEGGVAQIFPQEYAMLDFDYLRAAAYQYYVRNAMILADLLRATIHADFIDYLLDESEKTLMKDMMSIESDTDEAELKQMLPVNPDALQRSLDIEVNKSRSLEAIPLTLGQLREELRSAMPSAKDRVQ